MNKSTISNKRMRKRASRTSEQKMERQHQARERFWQMTQELQKAFEGVDPREIESEIEQAVREVRAAKKTA